MINMSGLKTNKNLPLRYWILVVCVLMANTLKSQVSPSGAVCISENQGDSIAATGAILELKAREKGLLIPRMTMAAMLNIHPDSTDQGLMVYITDNNDSKGFWAYNSKEKKFQQLRKAGTSFMDVKAPQESIIMYSGPMGTNANSTYFDANGCGKPGTRMEGWQICNGNNGTVNLSGRFIEGSGSESMGKISDTTVQTPNSFKLKVENMPSHTHEFKKDLEAHVKPHTHGLNDPGHTHTTEVTKKHKTFPWQSSDDYIERKAHDKGERDSKSQTGPSKWEQESGPVINETAVNIPVNYNKYSISDAGEGKSIEKRPPFYVLIFLMKKDGCP